MSMVPPRPAQDRKWTGRSSRNKGGRAEAEIVTLAQAHGFDQARRNFGSGARGGGDVIGIPGCHVEVKRQERCAIWEWIAQCLRDARPTDTPVVAFRRNGSDWMACLPLDELLALLAARETT